MAITASFSADFSDFSREVDKAEQDLTDFVLNADQAGAAIVQMSDKSAKAAPNVQTLSATARQFDQSLAALGINIGPATRAIGEIEAVAGKSATALGALGTAGAVLSAAVGGWQIGRKIAESLGTDKWIADHVAAWMGWGDVAKETAGAVADAAKYAAERTVPEVQKITKAFAVDQAEKAKWIAAQKAEWDAAFAIRDRLFGDDAIKKADDYAKAIGLLGGYIDSLTKDQLAELQTAMLEGIDAMARSGRLTDAQSSSFAALAAQAGAALDAMRPIVQVNKDLAASTEDLVKAQWDYALATDAALAASIKQRDAAKAAADEAAPAGGLNKPPGVLLPPGGFALKPYEHVPTDLFGRPTTPGFASGLGTVNVNVYGSVLQTEQQLAQAVEGAMMNSYRKGGNRLPV